MCFFSCIKIGDDWKRCPACLEVVTDPRVLPCGHVFCLICLQCIVKIKGIIQCQMCRAYVKKNPKMLPKDINYQAMLLLDEKNLQFFNAMNDLATERRKSLNMGNCAKCEDCREQIKTAIAFRGCRDNFLRDDFLSRETDAMGNLLPRKAYLSPIHCLNCTKGFATFRCPGCHWEMFCGERCMRKFRMHKKACKKMQQYTKIILESHMKYFSSTELALIQSDVNPKACGMCHQYDVKLKVCAGCDMVKYCSKPCQIKDWQKGHKQVCKTVKQLRRDVSELAVMVINATDEATDLGPGEYLHSAFIPGLVIDDCVDDQYFIHTDKYRCLKC